VNRTNASASDNNDAAAVASLFTEDAVLVTDSGPVYGRDAIEKYYTAVFKKFHFRNHVTKADQNLDNTRKGLGLHCLLARRL
jgi:uncharacterized protein (TIGR02246 family)